MPPRRRLNAPVPEIECTALLVGKLFEDVGVQLKLGLGGVCLLQQAQVVLFLFVGPLAERGVALVLLLQVLVLVFNHLYNECATFSLIVANHQS